ncbi:transposase [Paenibacillus timonensis]|uniref:Transposase n=1 Tax=Paenibacillus timonensis TaxID=225915 RepID=A0ABW3SHC1_9BACL
MSKKKLSTTEKLAILQEIESGHIGVKGAVRKYGLNKSTIAKWRRRYQLYGYEGLAIRTRNRAASLFSCNLVHLQGSTRQCQFSLAMLWNVP